ncbi:hypothetical protein MKX31_28745 [Bacillus sp. FSL M8-0063]|uniref:DUF4760 domain-containing protein n=1 Tax=Bacillus sp. FSL M8-0063 TaxID=2921566 RepID=UPI0030FA3B18
MDSIKYVISEIKPILEALYYLAGIGLLTTVIIALKQLQVVKQDMDIRNKRAAVEKSIEYLKWFSSEYIPKVNKVLGKITIAATIDKLNPMNDLFFPDDSHKTPEVQTLISEAKKHGGLDILNDLEFFSTAVLNGLSDEKILYKPLAKSYCSIVAVLYPVICNYRATADPTNGYSNIMKLYKIWNDRGMKVNMEYAKSNLEEDISKIKDVDIKSIGL